MDYLCGCGTESVVKVLRLGKKCQFFWAFAGAFLLYGSECVFTAIFVAVVMPETRGKTLEEIEAYFRR